MILSSYYPRSVGAFALVLCAAVLASPAARAGDDDDEDSKTSAAPAAPAPAKAEPEDEDKAAAEQGEKAAAKIKNEAANGTDGANPLETPDTKRKGPPAIDPLSGTPLGWSGKRQHNHALTRPPSAMAGRFEISVTMPVQVNPVFTEHVGNGAELEFHLAEPFGIVVGGTYYWLSKPTDFTDVQLLQRAQQEPTASEAVATQWEMHAAFEFMPIYAKMAFFGAGTLRFGIYVGAGAGVADTTVELQPASTGVQETFGDAGLKPTAYFNAGFRLFFGEHFAVRLELRDMIYSAYVNTIRGCYESQIPATANANGASPTAACSAAFKNPTDANDAYNILAVDESPAQTTKIIDNFQFAAAFSVLF